MPYTDLEAYFDLLTRAVVSAARGAVRTPIRVLEVGGGLGLLARRLLPRLKGHQFEYLYTDLSRAFVEQAKQRFRADEYPFVNFRVLDITNDPCPQGIESHRYDIVLGFDVFHATPDLRRSLTQAKKLLRPGGALLLLESESAPHWTNMLWGITPQWWHFADLNVRRSVPQIRRNEWEALLREVGFDGVTSTPWADDEHSDYNVLVARTSPEDGPRRTDAVASDRSHTLARLRRDGAQVFYHSADVSDEQQMGAAISRVTEEFGEIHGVIHAASDFTPADAKSCSHLTVGDFEKQFAPKVHGTRILAKLLRDHKLDFVLLFSSNTSVLGGPGLIPYAAANCFLDAFAAQQHQQGRTAWRCANWDGWPRDVEDEFLQTSIASYAMTADEAIDACGRLLAGTDAEQVVVSTGDLMARRRQWLQGSGRETDASRGELPPRRAEAAAPLSADETIRALWTEVLGHDEISSESNFFDHGGDSVLALQLISRIKERMGIDLPAVTLFEAPTIRALSQRISQRQEENKGLGLSSERGRRRRDQSIDLAGSVESVK
jgi:SAM-dependent methyltransferase/acyl carrier protein